MNSWLTGKDSDAGRDWGQEEKGTTEDEMAGWHHGLGRRESEWTPGVGDGLGGLACCNSWVRKESDTIERLNWTELNCTVEKAKEFLRKTSALLTMLKPLTVWITTNCGKFLKRWEYQNHLTCLVRNLYAGQEATVRTGHGKMDRFEIGKGVRQGCILSPCLFNLYADYIMRNTK